MQTLELTAIPCLSDNYAWLLRDAGTGTVAVVDPGEAEPVEQALAARGLGLDLILITHHHGDHVGGVAALKAAHGAAVLGPAADAHRLPALDRALKEGDRIAVGGATAVVIDTPGHTRGHIAFHFPAEELLLCGDTLFSLGCGRLLEGTPAEMFTSLRKFAALPPETRIACGHEYTLSNARFALSVDPGNAALKARAAQAEADRAAGEPTLPALLGDELAANPFLRAADVATLAKLRAAKDDFR
jgi:hydroxyacylglutathione hydrolase